MSEVQYNQTPLSEPVAITLPAAEWMAIMGHISGEVNPGVLRSLSNAIFEKVTPMAYRKGLEAEEAQAPESIAGFLRSMGLPLPEGMDIRMQHLGQLNLDPPEAGNEDD